MIDSITHGGSWNNSNNIEQTDVCNHLYMWDMDIASQILLLKWNVTNFYQ